MNFGLNNERILAFVVRTEGFSPRRPFSRVQHFRHCGHRFLTITEHGYIYGHVFVHLGRVDVKVNLPCLTGIRGEIASHTVIKTHTDSDEQVAALCHRIGTQTAMHSEHSHV